MKAQSKHAKRFSEISADVQGVSNYGFGTGIASNKKDIVTKSGGGGGGGGGGCCCCCCCCCGTGSADLKI